MHGESDETYQPTGAAVDVAPIDANAANNAATPHPTQVNYVMAGDVNGEANGASASPYRFARWLVTGVVAVMVVTLFWFGPQLWHLVRDEQALEAWVSNLGWWGPVALVALNAVQIVAAPIPGYVVQVAAGFLFGPIWGGVWANLGLLLGASLAFWLARFYGRPLAAHLVGAERLAQWEHVTHSSSTLLWFILLITPVGDLPYFLAGLARVSFVKILLLTLLVRVPSTFMVAAAGAGVMFLTWWQVVILFAVLFALLLLFLRYQDQIVHWSDRHVHRRMQEHLPPQIDGRLSSD